MFHSHCLLLQEVIWIDTSRFSQGMTVGDVDLAFSFQDFMWCVVGET